MAKTKPSGLGRGLDSIFFDNAVDSTSSGVTMLRLSLIEPNPDQPRKEFDPEALSALASSIATHGLIQPLVIRPALRDGYYQIIAGERRWRASKIAGLSEVPVIIMDADDSKAAQLALVENIQRADLNPIEEAAAAAALLTATGMTQEELAGALGKSRSALTNLLRLLDLPEQVITWIRDGSLSVGHGKCLLGLQEESAILAAAKTVLDKSLSVRQTEALVKSLSRKKQEKAKAEPTSLPPLDYTALLAERMTSRMGRPISIRNTPTCRQMVITFSDDEDLDALVRRLCGDDIFDRD